MADRPKHSTLKLNYGKLHTEGRRESDTETTIMEEVNRLKEELMKQKEENERLQNEAQAQELRNQIELQKKQKEKWELTINSMKSAQEKALQACDTEMEKIKTTADEFLSTYSKEEAVKFLQQKLQALQSNDSEELKLAQEKKKKELEKLQELREQQKNIEQQIATLMGEDTGRDTTTKDDNNSTQDTWVTQLRQLLGDKTEDDTNKALLKALMAQSNRTNTSCGANALRPELLSKITGGGDNLSMPQWLANLNNKNLDTGEFTFDSKCEEEIKGKQKSGMLNRATAHIYQKQVWPQKNLREDWAEEELDFKQIQFEHLVAGETRTIKMCSEPAQILGRLRLLRRISYLKLRGYDWPMLRKMYAAILSSIEMGEQLGLQL